MFHSMEPVLLEKLARTPADDLKHFCGYACFSEGVIGFRFDGAANDSVIFASVSKGNGSRSDRSSSFSEIGSISCFGLWFVIL